MASGAKTNSVFTSNDMGTGPSSGMKIEKGPDGMKMVSSYPQDNVHGMKLPDTMGGEFGGSDTNLKHSLTGASAVQRQTGKAENSGI